MKRQPFPILYASGILMIALGEAHLICVEIVRSERGRYRSAKAELIQ